MYNIARIATDSNGFKWELNAGLGMGSRGIHFQQLWFYYHNISFHSLWPPILEHIETFFLTSMKPQAWQASEAIPGLLFIPFGLIYVPLLGRARGPVVPFVNTLPVPPMWCMFFWILSHSLLGWLLPALTTTSLL